jgi:hypothetical protein
MERIQRAHLSHREQVRAELARLDDFEGSLLPSLSNASNRAERDGDARIEAEERS